MREKKGRRVSYRHKGGASEKRRGIESYCNCLSVDGGRRARKDMVKRKEYGEKRNREKGIVKKKESEKQYKERKVKRKRNKKKVGQLTRGERERVGGKKIKPLRKRGRNNREKKERKMVRIKREREKCGERSKNREFHLPCCLIRE